MNLAQILEASADYGEAEYLVSGGPSAAGGGEASGSGVQRVSFAQNHARAHALACALAGEYGVRRGDRVALLAANSIEWITGFWAIAALGGVAVAMNSRWAGPEVAHALDLTGPALVIADAARRPLLEDADRGGAAVLAMEDVPALIAGHGAGTASGGVLARDEDPATILFTSGTTGRAKGVVHPQRSVAATAERQRAARAADPDPRRYLLATPLFHVAALHNLSVPRLLLGDTAVLSAGRFDIDAVTRLIERERITHWSAVPTMAVRLAALIEEHPDAARRLRSLRALSLITAPASEELQRRLRAAAPTVRTALAATYGLTETACPVTAATDADLRADPLCVGTPVPRMEVRIAGDGAAGAAWVLTAEGDAAGPGAGVGEIQARGPHLMSGYWRDEAATAAAFTADGWLRTGDVGEFVDGRLRVHSRRTDLIIRGGENVYPAEVEAVIESHPGVAECMVHGADDDDWGQVVCAVVVPADAGERAPDAAEATDALSSELVDDLTGHASARLASYKVPVRWSVRRAPLPRNASGKVVRARVLQDT